MSGPRSRNPATGLFVSTFLEERYLQQLRAPTCAEGWRRSTGLPEEARARGPGKRSCRSPERHAGEATAGITTSQLLVSGPRREAQPAVTSARLCTRRQRTPTRPRGLLRGLRTFPRLPPPPSLGELPARRYIRREAARKYCEIMGFRCRQQSSRCLGTIISV